jgi:hypothetical protein
LAGRFRFVDDGNTPLGCSELIALSRGCPFLHPSLRLLGDVAYHGDSRVRSPWRRPDLTVGKAGSSEAAEARRQYNMKLSKERVIVEHAFSRLKHTWRLLQVAWPYPMDELPRAVRAGCLLCNWLLRTRGIDQSALEAEAMYEDLHPNQTESEHEDDEQDSMSDSE